MKPKAYLVSELKTLRRSFYILQLVSFLTLFLSILSAGLAGVFFGSVAAVIAFTSIFIVFTVIHAYLEGEFLVIQCPNCNGYFYSIIKWPFIGWLVFWFFSDCRRCGLNIHGKNIEKYSEHTQQDA